MLRFPRRGEAGVTGETTAFADARIFDGVSAELREGCVRVAAGTIVEVAGGPGPGDRIIDCRGRTVVPGLIDAHFHAYGARLSLLEIETSPLSYLALAGARRLAGALGRGFTTVRDPGGGDAGLAQAIREGLTAAPRYLFCGPALSQTGGHGDPRPPGLGCCLGGGHMAEVVDGVDALRRAARERLRSGAHAIKIMASGGVISPSDPLRMPQYSPEEIRAVAEEATRRGSYVAAHAYSAEAIAVAVANGVRSIEHGNLLDAPAAALMAERDAFLVPTLVTYDAMERRGAELGLAPVAQAKNREVLDAGRTAIRLAREAGVRIGFGTDLMGTLDDEQLHGLRLQAEVEGPLAVLRAATSVNAELLGRDDLGRIGPGAVADLLVLDGDPLQDPSVLWGDPNRRAVFQGGTRVAEQDARLVLLSRTARTRRQRPEAAGRTPAPRTAGGAAVPPGCPRTRTRPRTAQHDGLSLPAASRTEDHGGLRLPVRSREDQLSGRRHRSWRRADGDSACESASWWRRRAGTRPWASWLISSAGRPMTGSRRPGCRTSSGSTR